MIRFRFSLVSLLAAVVLFALLFAALRWGTVWWASLIFTSALCILCCTIVGAIVGYGRTRAFCVGFAVFGLGYLFVIFAGYVDWEIGQFLVTNPLLEQLWPKTHQSMRDIQNAYKLRKPEPTQQIGTARACLADEGFR